MTWRVRLSSVLYRRAVAKAGSDAALAALVAAALEAYAAEPVPVDARQASMRDRWLRLAPDETKAYTGRHDPG